MRLKVGIAGCAIVASAFTVHTVMAQGGEDEESGALGSDNTIVLQESEVAAELQFQADEMIKKPNEERRAPESFFADLDAAMARSGLKIGDPCEGGDSTWIMTIEDPVYLAPVAGADASGKCVVVGWTYLGTNDFEFELPMDKHG